MQRIGLIFILFLSYLVPKALAQDERFYRQIFTGELGKNSQDSKKGYKWEVKSPQYQLDLDSDGLSEGIQLQKRDGEDWIVFSGKKGEGFFSAKLQAKGRESSLFRINLVTLNPDVKVLVLSFYEGFTHYLQFNGTARMYLISFEHNDLSTMQLAEGPTFWIEREKVDEQYFKRAYSIEILDLNSDKSKEIIVGFNAIKRVLTYAGNGRFISPP